MGLQALHTQLNLHSRSPVCSMMSGTIQSFAVLFSLSLYPVASSSCFRASNAGRGVDASSLTPTICCCTWQAGQTLNPCQQLPCVTPLPASWQKRYRR